MCVCVYVCVLPVGFIAPSSPLAATPVGRGPVLVNRFTFPGFPAKWYGYCSTCTNLETISHTPRETTRLPKHSQTPATEGNRKRSKARSRTSTFGFFFSPVCFFLRSPHPALSIWPSPNAAGAGFAPPGVGSLASYRAHLICRQFHRPGLRCCFGARSKESSN